MTIQGTTVHIWYLPTRLDGYTILIGNDLWGCSSDVNTLNGYAGNLIENGWTASEYHIWASSSNKRIGRKLESIEQVPEEVVEWVKQIVNSEKE